MTALMTNKDTGMLVEIHRVRSATLIRYPLHASARSSLYR